MAMELGVKAQVVALMESDQGLNSKLDKIVEVLKAHSLAWVATLTPDLLLTHPENRGGTMCNPFDCHFKGEKILTTGLKAALLPANSVAIEMFTESQYKAVANSEEQGSLSQLSEHACPSEWQRKVFDPGMLTFCSVLQGLARPSSEPSRRKAAHLPLELESVTQNGWQWCVISCRVEEALPGFPRFCQLSLNSSNTTALASTELQTMLQIAKLLEGGVSVQNALMSVKAGEPACGPYLQDVAHYVMMFGGGPTMPLLRHLHAFSAMATLIFLF